MRYGKVCLNAARPVTRSERRSLHQQAIHFLAIPFSSRDLRLRLTSAQIEKMSFHSFCSHYLLAQAFARIVILSRVILSPVVKFLLKYAIRGRVRWETARIRAYVESNSVYRARRHGLGLPWLLIDRSLIHPQVYGSPICKVRERPTNSERTARPTTQETRESLRETFARIYGISYNFVRPIAQSR